MFLRSGAGSGIRTHETITVTDLAGLRPTRLGDPGKSCLIDLCLNN